MMGKSHALSGAVGWLGGCAALVAAGHPPRPLSVVAGAVVSAGFALLPDIDHPGSTVARTLGPLTRTLSRVVSGLSAGVRPGHLRPLRPPPRPGRPPAGHAHVPFALAVFALWSRSPASCGASVASVVVVGFAVWLATHTGLRTNTRAEIVDALIPGQIRGQRARRFTAVLGSVIAGGAVAFAVRVLAEPGGSWWWVGAAAGWGTLAHSLGDSLPTGAARCCGRPGSAAAPGARSARRAGCGSAPAARSSAG